ncbi:MAG TPA: hypothetical protein VGF39_04765 [Stellaceae bacterium]|jgi:hypothetical protein
MESQRKPSPGQWAPWIDDPDPPEEPMSPEQLEKFGKGAKALLEKLRQQERSNKPDAEK